MANILPVSPARASSGTAPLADRGALRGAVVLAVVTLAGFGFLYSLAGVGIGQALFPPAAAGSLVARGSRLVGSALVAPPFAGARSQAAAATRTSARRARRARGRAARVRGAVPAMPAKGWWPAIPRAGSSASSVRRASTCWP